MKHFIELSELESSIIRVEEMKNLLRVLANGMESSNKDEIMSTVYYIEGSIEDICESLRGNFRELFDAIKEDSNKKGKNK